MENVSFAYPDGNEAIREVSVGIGPGECVGLVGANGAGKSTLLDLLLGIRTPRRGTVRMVGLELKKETLPAIRAKTGMVFQNPDEQLFMTTAREDILFGPQNMGFSEEEAQSALARVAEELQISHLLDRMPHKLSGGEKRLVAIASVLVYGPQIVLFDEPTSFLDPRARARMAGILRALPQTRLIATHDLDMALEVCGRVLILCGGAIAADGGPELLRDGPLLRDCGLELPLSVRGGDR